LAAIRAPVFANIVEQSNPQRQKESRCLAFHDGL
jgi:hypothetical protein